MRGLLLSLLGVLIGCGYESIKDTAPAPKPASPSVYKFFCTPDNHATWHVHVASAGLTAPMLSPMGEPEPCEDAKREYPGLYEELK